MGTPKGIARVNGAFVEKAAILLLGRGIAKPDATYDAVGVREVVFSRAFDATDGAARVPANIVFELPRR